MKMMKMRKMVLQLSAGFLTGETKREGRSVLDISSNIPRDFEGVLSALQ